MTTNRCDWFGSGREPGPRVEGARNPGPDRVHRQGTSSLPSSTPHLFEPMDGSFPPRVDGTWGLPSSEHGSLYDVEEVEDPVDSTVRHRVGVGVSG